MPQDRAELLSGHRSSGLMKLHYFVQSTIGESTRRILATFPFIFVSIGLVTLIRSLPAIEPIIISVKAKNHESPCQRGGVIARDSFVLNFESEYYLSWSRQPKVRCE